MVLVQANLPNSLDLKNSDVADFKILAMRLRDCTDVQSRSLMSSFSPNTQEALRSWDGSSPVPEDLKSMIVGELNQLIRGNVIFDGSIQQYLSLRDETRKLLDQNPSGNNLVRLNRMLLEDAYVSEILKYNRIKSDAVLPAIGDLDQERRNNRNGAINVISGTSQGSYGNSDEQNNANEIRNQSDQDTADTLNQKEAFRAAIERYNNDLRPAGVLTNYDRWRALVEKEANHEKTFEIAGGNKVQIKLDQQGTVTINVFDKDGEGTDRSTEYRISQPQDGGSRGYICSISSIYIKGNETIFTADYFPPSTIQAEQEKSKRYNEPMHIRNIDEVDRSKLNQIFQSLRSKLQVNIAPNLPQVSNPDITKGTLNDLGRRAVEIIQESFGYPN
jgi:hypothetical protein